MQQFTQRFAAWIRGSLSGWDRIRLRGTLRELAYVNGMMTYLSFRSVLLKNFGEWADATTRQIRSAVEAQADQLGMEVRYLRSPAINKEAYVQDILAERGRDPGFVAILSCVEPCRSYQIRRNHQTKQLDLEYTQRQCLHYYHYFLDDKFGLVHVRTQTWAPYTVQLCINGREWLSRQLDAAQLKYVRQDNCFLELEDCDRAQRLMNQQLRVKWRFHLNRLMRQANPAFPKFLHGYKAEYYWSMEESEWATDVMFQSPEALQSLYPGLIRYATEHFNSRDVMRYLGHRVPRTGMCHGSFTGEVVSDLRERLEGIRIKHRVRGNSIKMYDKFGQVLRVETTINQPAQMKVYRAKEGDSGGPKSWRQMRKGVADSHRRAHISQKANERYLDGLAQMELDTPLGKLLEPVTQRTTFHGSSVRALRPFDQDDHALLRAISQGQFALQGFRNADIRAILNISPGESDPQARKRQAAAMTRRFRLLRAHGIIQKIHATHRYQLTDFGRALTAAVISAHRASVQKLTSAA